MKPSKKYLYRTNSFVVKTNPKARPSSGDQENEAQTMCYHYLNQLPKLSGAIDIGARYGGWARPMQIKFEKLYAFEPRQKWQILFERNIIMDNVTLFPYGLGAQNETVYMKGNQIQPGGLESVEVKRLDDFNLTDISFIKIDTDGYELNVLSGGLQTILREKPIICCEINNQETLDWFKRHNAEIIDSLRNNTLFRII